jgi:hypothetical protein
MRLPLDARRQVLVFLGAYLLYGMSRWVAVGDVGVATDNVVIGAGLVLIGEEGARIGAATSVGVRDRRTVRR